MPKDLDDDKEVESFHHQHGESGGEVCNSSTTAPESSSENNRSCLTIPSDIEAPDDDSFGDEVDPKGRDNGELDDVGNASRHLLLSGDGEAAGNKTIKILMLPWHLELLQHSPLPRKKPLLQNVITCVRRDEIHIDLHPVPFLHTNTLHSLKCR